MTTYFGTANYRSLRELKKAYGREGHRTALDEGRVFLGEPDVDRAKGERLFVDEGGRYHIAVPEPKKGKT